MPSIYFAFVHERLILLTLAACSINSLGIKVTYCLGLFNMMEQTIKWKHTRQKHTIWWVDNSQFTDQRQLLGDIETDSLWFTFVGETTEFPHIIKTLCCRWKTTKQRRRNSSQSRYTTETDVVLVWVRDTLVGFI